jgi:opacity protein-like surface antigen
MKRFRVELAAVFALVVLFADSTTAQIAPGSTRFTITAASVLSQPRGEFRQNIGSSFGAAGAVLYHLDRPGFVSLRFDVSGVPYGHETKPLPPTASFTERVFLKVTTTNWMTALNFGPEFALPRGPVRPYVNAGLSELLLRTSSSVKGTSSSEPFATSTNYSDSTAGWFLGGGVRIPLAGNDPRKAISLDLGARYHRGGTASYLREGSIQDNPNGSVSFTPITSHTSQIVYLIGVRYRIPHDPSSPCHRFLC